jgi:ATP-dependent protease ClpP protease subunit
MPFRLMMGTKQRGGGGQRKRRRRRNKGEDSGDDSDASGGGGQGYSFKVQDNEIWMYGAISENSVFELNMALSRLHRKLQRAKDGRIVVHLMTEGGCVFSALSTYDLIRSLSKDVIIEIICEGQVASSGTLILMAASVRTVRKSAFLLIHEISGYCGGKSTAMEEELENIKMMTEKLKAVYKSRSSLAESELTKLLKTDIYFTAKKSLALGLVDRVV